MVFHYFRLVLTHMIMQIIINPRKLILIFFWVIYIKKIIRNLSEKFSDALCTEEDTLLRRVELENFLVSELIQSSVSIAVVIKVYM